MKTITPNYINELADTIARALEREFPATQFVIQPEVSISTLFRSTHKDDCICFDILAQEPVGQVHRQVTLKVVGEGLESALASQLAGLVKDLKTLLSNPSLDEAPDVQA